MSIEKHQLESHLEVKLMSPSRHNWREAMPVVIQEYLLYLGYHQHHPQVEKKDALIIADQLLNRIKEDSIDDETVQYYKTQEPNTYQKIYRDCVWYLREYGDRKES